MRLPCHLIHPLSLPGVNLPTLNQMEIGSSTFVALKTLHIALVLIWIASGIYLPLVYAGHSRMRGKEAPARLITLERTLYFGVMTPSAILAVAFGTWLVIYRMDGGWLPVKLTVVLLLVLFHLYCGRLLLLFEKHRVRHRRGYYLLLSVVPLPLAITIFALAVIKPTL